jgi:hypothetical protein
MTVLSGPGILDVIPRQTFAEIGVLHILPAGYFEIRTDDFLDNVGGTPLVVNEGTVRKVAGTNTTTAQIRSLTAERGKSSREHFSFRTDLRTREVQ